MPGVSVPTISILLPVLRRPAAALPVWESIAESASVPTEVIYLCSPRDGREQDACEQVVNGGSGGLLTGMVVVVGWKPGQGDYARKINFGFQVAQAPFVFTGADDIRFTPGWDRLALQAAGDGGGVIGTDDQCNPRTRGSRRHSTHSLVRRAYIDEHGGTIDGTPGVVLHDGYWHNFCDDELVMVARYRSVYRPSSAVVRHLHPMRKTAPMDATYTKGQQRFADDRLTFGRRTAGIGRRFR